ncbi:MAG: YdcF family protein [Burkholderiales bacterium]
MDPIWVKAVVKALVLPPGGPLLLALAGLALAGWYPRTGRVMAAVGVLSLLLLSTPRLTAGGWPWLDRAPPLAADEAKSAQALVILGSGIRPNAVEFGGDTLGRRTLERVRYGAGVARQTGLPVLVSGGTVYGGRPEADLMRAALEQEFQVPVRWAEARSRTTHENALYSAEILRAAGVHRIVLVVHGVDLRRARAEFEAQGIEIVPAPTGIPAPSVATALDWLPSMSGLVGGYEASYESLALLVQWLRIPN